MLTIRLLMTCALLLAAAARAEVVNVYTSANFPPLMLGDGRGIYPDMVAYLNGHQTGKLTFVLRYLPRKRLQVQLENGSIDGIVIGMMPEWLGDSAQKKYLWTAPFASDRFALVSRPAKPCSANTLQGASVGVTAGYVYPGIDRWLDASGALRKDASGDQSNIEKVLHGRIDCAIVAESMARYFIRFNRLHGKLTLAVLQGPRTERRFLVPHSQASKLKPLVRLVDKVNADPAWRRIAASYE
jgi:polar amino acid transport system substrate-binding protein